MFHSQNDAGNFVDFYSRPGLWLRPVFTVHPGQECADRAANLA